MHINYCTIFPFLANCALLLYSKCMEIYVAMFMLSPVKITSRQTSNFDDLLAKSIPRCGFEYLLAGSGTRVYKSTL